MSAEEIVVRPVVEADIDVLRALAEEIWREHYTSIIGSAQIDYMLDQRYGSEVLRAELLRSDLWWDLLLIEGEPQGYSSYFFDPDEDSLRLDKLYVRRDCRRMGLGPRMLERVLARASVLRCSRVCLAVNKFNPSAIAAYRKWNFRIERSVVKPIGGGFVMDDYIMVRDV
jgi:diamine N-acetyltransferase